ncbi:metal-dependent hydrolase [Gluconobacter wancherniae]|uniref:metal-dependent hydrolase n=1 Tax=Gluconobacter wancherniae TaxID=1307955 RepID=UPI00309A6FC8
MRWHFLTPEPFSVVAALFGSVLPDIDTERSIVGARCKPLSRLIARTFGHRGMTHSGVLLLLSSETAKAASQTQIETILVSLYRALGGGWQFAETSVPDHKGA